MRCTYPSPPPSLVQATVNDQKLTEPMARVAWTRGLRTRYTVDGPCGKTWCTTGGGGGRFSRQVKFAVGNFAVGNFAVGNFAEPPGLSVSPPARVHSVYCWYARNSRGTLNAKLKCHGNPPPPPVF